MKSIVLIVPAGVRKKILSRQKITFRDRVQDFSTLRKFEKLINIVNIICEAGS